MGYFNPHLFGFKVAYEYDDYALVSCPFHNDTNPSAFFYKNSCDFVCKSCTKTTRGYKALINALVDDLGFSYDDFVGYDDDDNGASGTGKLKTFFNNAKRDNYIQGKIKFPVESYPKAMDYLITKRDLSPETIETFSSTKSIGWIPEDRISGQIAFTNRAINSARTRVLNVTSDGLRYRAIGPNVPRIWPQHGSLSVFEPSPDLESVDYLFIFEGAFKLMKFFQGAKLAGLLSENENVKMGALLGATLKREAINAIAQCRLKSPLGLVYVGDNDDAGKKVGWYFKKVFPASRIWFPKIPFDDMTDETAQRGAIRYFEDVNERLLKND